MTARLISWLSLAGIFMAAVAGAQSPDNNERERPVQAVDMHTEGGLVGAFAALRIDKLAGAFDELLTMPPPGTLGGPRDDLSWRALIDFADGRMAFRQVLSEKQGLGPGFNERSCAGCHMHPNVGGSGKDMSSAVHTIAPPDDPKDTIGTHKFAIAGHKPFKPTAATPQRRTPPLYGIGLLDAVPDQVLEEIADPGDRDKNGVRGVLNSRGHPAGGVRPARFGHKANELNLLRFIGGALANEMGVTNRASRAPPRDKDNVQDPEAPPGFVARLDAYVRGLAPPPRGPVTTAVKRGEQLFTTLGCVGCHRPTIGAVQGAYTDLLLHDLGAAVSDGLYDGKAGPTSWRTPALWGLRHKKRYLHDERAPNFDVVLAFHGNEAAKPARRYRDLTKIDQEALKAFLMSL